MADRGDLHPAPPARCPATAPAAPPPPPPVPDEAPAAAQAGDPYNDLLKLKELLDAGALTQAEFGTQKQKILSA
ncbi:MAG: SHOCT domain-containing protein [Streptosporangiaceae bacterium]